MTSQQKKSKGFWTDRMVKNLMNQRDYRREKQNRAEMEIWYKKFRAIEADIKQKMFSLRKQANQAFRNHDVHLTQSITSKLRDLKK